MRRSVRSFRKPSLQYRSPWRCPLDCQVPAQQTKEVGHDNARSKDSDPEWHSDADGDANTDGDATDGDASNDDSDGSDRSRQKTEGVRTRLKRRTAAAVQPGKYTEAKSDDESDSFDSVRTRPKRRTAVAVQPGKYTEEKSDDESDSSVASTAN